MAARPGGLLATKVHFKHLQVATSEGYAARPGGAQAVFHQEWKKEEAKEKRKRTVEAYRQFEQGQLPAGPGADALLATFRAIEDELEGHDPGPAKVVTDRQLELLLKQKASVLHLSAANYCWFEGPAKALCLKLAGSKSATAPLTGLCDSSRCPQATHHLVHRPVWQTAADNGADMLASPRIPPGEKNRLRAEHERSMRRSTTQPERAYDMALSQEQRDQIERRIRAAIDRLLSGKIPPGGACDIKTLAREAGISRASLYRTWGHLKDEFEKRRAAAWAAGQQPDPREARIARLRDLNHRLTGKLARTHTEFNQLKERHRLLLSALAAKDDELQRLRRELSTFSHTSPAPAPEPRQGDDTSGVVPLPRR
ncbi:hypothetical protein [Streptomyces javensis]